MPPKKGAKGSQPSKKTVEKKKAKVVEDRTFGLKNKNKSKAVQKYVHSVESSIKGSQKGKQMSEYEQRQKKLEQEKKKAFEDSIYQAAVVQQKVPPGVDPKSVLCDLFRKGSCKKGNRCKFSHDLNKIMREQAMKKEEEEKKRKEQEAKDRETMEDWDTEQLAKIVEAKQGLENKNLPTQIICKHFLKALETQHYGWKWECPNGGKKCIYKHTLPPGYVLKSKKKKEPEEDEDYTPLEEVLEEERNQLETRTPLTLELFMKWKKEKAAAKEAEQKKHLKEVKANRNMRSGKEMFEFNPELFVDDESAVESSGLVREEDPDEGPVNILEATATSLSRTVVGADYGEGDEEGSTTTQQTAETSQTAQADESSAQAFDLGSDDEDLLDEDIPDEE